MVTGQQPTYWFNYNSSSNWSAYSKPTHQQTWTHQSTAMATKTTRSDIDIDYLGVFPLDWVWLGWGVTPANIGIYSLVELALFDFQPQSFPSCDPSLLQSSTLPAHWLGAWPFAIDAAIPGPGPDLGYMEMEIVANQHRGCANTVSHRSRRWKENRQGFHYLAFILPGKSGDLIVVRDEGMVVMRNGVESWKKESVSQLAWTDTSDWGIGWRRHYCWELRQSIRILLFGDKVLISFLWGLVYSNGNT